MGVVTLEKEITVAIPPAKTFKVFVLESDTAIPSILPQAVKTVEIIEGNGGPGTIKKITFGEGGDFKYMKSKVEVVDKDTLTHCYSVIGGDPWSDLLEKISYENKIVASPDGGSIIKCTSKFFPKGNAELDKEKAKARAEKTWQIFKTVEAYLLANPDAYN
ncbi:hypothetical protein P3X46_027883 [Hevea brasiliensis]|uniref:Bet v I/Major latex protein domain-containing protein n=1 Tax=Hevea brasiliensis TaxID=3981 RepID=A0ABQ9L159_HEVBR|nr:major allergen Pru ar 1-like [Hevea brasiliensis]KAJ9154563.1 hypothetical protein P3X46_027883 [Hevea brasiliensis]